MRPIPSVSPDHTSRPIPSVNPEELRRLCYYQLKRGVKVCLDAPSLGFSTDAVIRQLELHRFGLTYACLLPGFLQRMIFKKAATIPLESVLPEMFEQNK
jgi:hypothetical protein